MITIEEAKELGFVEKINSAYWQCDLGEMSLQLYSNTMYLSADYIDWDGARDSKDIIISHLNAEQVKQLITLLKP